MSFHVGQKVVCVDDSRCRVTGGPTPLIKGRIYVIERLLQHGETIIFRGKPGIGLGFGFELIGIDSEGIGWDASRFRPLEEMQAEARERAKKSEPATHHREEAK